MDDRLKDRMAFLGSLASGLAHEIKNPLSTMTITLGLLHEDFEHAETPREKRAQRKILLLEQEVGRLEKIVQDFLQFAGGHAVRPRLVDVGGWLGDLLDFFEPSCQGAAVELRRLVATELPQVLVDPDLMKQAILNLLTNALQATPPGGEMMVRARSTGDRVRIDVIDTGAGIPPDVMPRIFDPYFSTRESGTGLGLPTVRRIVAEHGGEVGVTSERGKGTCFTVTLPVPPTIGAEELRRLPGAPEGGQDLRHILAPDRDRGARGPAGPGASPPGAPSSHPGEEP